MVDRRDGRGKTEATQRRSGGPRGPGRHGARIERTKDVRGTLRRLLDAFESYKLALAAVALLVILGTGLNLLAPFLMGLAIDRFIAAGDRSGLLRIVLLMLGAYVGVWLAQAGQFALMATMSQKVLRDLRKRLFVHLQGLSLSYFDRHPHGELMSRLTNDLDVLNRVLSQQVTQTLSSLLTLVGILVMMFAINFWLALGSMIVFPFMLWFVGWVGRKTRSGFREYQARIGQLNGELEEMFSGQRVIIAFGQEARALADFDHANHLVRDVGVRAQTFAMLVPPLMGILSNANIAILAGLGGWMVLQGVATVGTIATFYNYSRRFAAPLRQLGNLYNQLQSALAGAERVFEIIDEEPDLPDRAQARELKRVEGEVVFDRVDFRYENDVPVIKDVSLEAWPGRTFALVGPTGAGKTTLVNLLTRFYDVDAGAITIDGIDIRDVEKESLRRQLGIVLQDTFLFSESVMENIRYGRLDATDDEVVDAARVANAHQFIRRLPEGYDTKLTERGANLSQGQRQLLAIARAVLADPAILILDEATSSVDTRTEMRIQEALLRLMEGRTSFVIAHRLSTIRDADRILVIYDGRIVERGNHEELLAGGGYYYDLYTSQFKGREMPEELPAPLPTSS